MLTDMNLDNENFEDLVEEAKNMIVSYYPEWTDFNYHDPGITISELFAFLKEAAQYRMNYIGDAHKMKYLKLMGVERRMRSQAKARLTVKSKENVWLPALTRFYASGICFENPEPKYIAAGDLSGCIFPAENGQVHLGSMQPGAKITPFGRKPKTDACFYIYFKERLPADIPLSVYVQAYDGYPVVRNELKESYDFYALAEMDMEYMSENGWQQCSVFEDGTKGFQQSGWLKFTLGGSHGFTEFGGGAGYFLRFRLKKADYDIPPVLVRIGMNVVDVCQTRHYVLSQDAECEQQEGRAVCRIEANEVTTGNLSVLEKVGEGYRIIENYSAEKKGHWIELSFPCDEQGHLPEQIRIIAWELMYDLSLMTEEGNGLPLGDMS